MKKGSSAEGSSGNTSIFKGGASFDPGVSSAGVNLKRAMCLIGVGQAVRQSSILLRSNLRREERVASLWKIPIHTS